MKANFSRTLLIVAIACVCSVTTSVFTVKAYERWTEPKVAGLHTFVTGSTIISADVNENFTLLSNAIDTLDVRDPASQSDPIGAGDTDSVTANCGSLGYAVGCSCTANDAGDEVFLMGIEIFSTACKCHFYNTSSSGKTISATPQCLSLP